MRDQNRFAAPAPRRSFSVYLRAALLAAALVLALVPAQPAAAHEQSTTYTTIRVDPAELGMTVSFRPSDLDYAFQSDTDGDGAVSGSELAAVAPAVYDSLGEGFDLAADFAHLVLEPGEARLGEDSSGRPLAVFPFRADLERLPGKVSVTIDLLELLGEDQLYFVKMESSEGVEQAILAADDASRSFEVGGEIPLGRQVWQFVKLGVEHIFIGFDHILFLVALILVGGRLINLLKIVTSFTVAHSITLGLAAVGAVQLPPALIEAGIAFSIAWVAAENLWLHKADHRWILTFFFGLVHGFGFANVLRDLGLPQEGLIASLLAFNLGVEIGQVVIVLILLPGIIWLSRQSFHRRVVQVISVLILLMGLGWLIERSFGLGFMPI